MKHQPIKPMDETVVAVMQDDTMSGDDSSMQADRQLEAMPDDHVFDYTRQLEALPDDHVCDYTREKEPHP